ncbi:MAG: 2-C-methyl-D-erythritol 2,4-cyclodiphosphate synthase [Alphaproteobacteria bacterium]|nr:MAG: 2-C-methyl-D-erythritol 2,4-cyclodiphosphate synthase [Alphaproteobacteria bacterium]
MSEGSAERAELGAVVVAAGRGLRAGGGVPKQYRRLGDRPVLAHALAAIGAAVRPGPVAVVIRAEDRPRFAAEVAPWVADLDLHLVEGGAERALSVRAGLEALAALPRPPRHVLIHDGARPAPGPVIPPLLEALAAGAPAAAPALAVTDALWRVEEGRAVAVVPREGLARAQTPQGFELATILAAHRALPAGEAARAADDVAIALAAGLDVTVTPGHEANIKITTPADFARAARLMGLESGMRIGTGYDVHAFGPGDHVTLCGVRIPHERALSGHSDADVAMHALTDAIYGALAEGDIGRHFPPSDPRWKGADSALFLAHAAERMRARGYALGNADVTIVCERPRIAPHAGAMAARLAAILGCEAGRISVKGTTSERLGFTGREEGIAALASVLLVTAGGGA